MIITAALLACAIHFTMGEPPQDTSCKDQPVIWSVESRPERAFDNLDACIESSAHTMLFLLTPGPLNDGYRSALNFPEVDEDGDEVVSPALYFQCKDDGKVIFDSRLDGGNSVHQ